MLGMSLLDFAFQRDTTCARLLFYTFTAPGVDSLHLHSGCRALPSEDRFTVVELKQWLARKRMEQETDTSTEQGSDADSDAEDPVKQVDDGWQKVSQDGDQHKKACTEQGGNVDNGAECSTKQDLGQDKESSTELFSTTQDGGVGNDSELSTMQAAAVFSGSRLQCAAAGLDLS
ncbi:unnamed protein product [Symbiodinium sp. CCMP2592]|nr:unnamed protein product [Symbiodinium sp. CCMP2592]